jgi:hypothetical protein
MCEVDWGLVLQALKVVLDPLAAAAWPIMIGIVAWAFYGELRALLNRLKHFSGFGGVAEFDALEAQQALQDDDVAAVTPSEVQVVGIPVPPPDAVHDPFDQELRADLDMKFGGDMEAKLKWAVRQRSLSEVSRRHEYTFRAIFGSQLQALKTINAMGEGPLSLLQPYYKEGVSSPAAKASGRQPTFEQWTDFLRVMGLIETVEGSEPIMVRITPLGRHFLAWIVQAGVFENKIG